MDVPSSSSLVSATKLRRGHGSLLTIPEVASATPITWGRSSIRRSWLRSTVAAVPCILAPVFSISFFVTLAEFDGRLSDFLAAGCRDGFGQLLVSFGPKFTRKSLFVYLGWVTLQAALFQWLPGPVNIGQRTPAGHLLSYRTNGLTAWAATHIVLMVLCSFGIVDAAFIPKNWSGLVAAMNLSGFLVSGFAYVKACYFPTHVDDRRFSGSIFYDYSMGVELNPRLGDRFDLKLFNNGRPGIVGWTLIDLSNLAYQQEKQGYVEPSLVLITILHTIYVLDFFANESWYLRTMDIAHDHFGFYLAWGCFCFLPTTYTIQSQYLGLYPSSPHKALLAFFFGVGVAAYIVFRSVNNQKDLVRRTNGDCLIWGKPAEYITAAYSTTDGAHHHSILLCSGWWGVSRHANYGADLLFSYSVCALVGTTKVIVWWYAIWMTGLLVHRCIRDEQRCSAKYGAAWTEYCRRVRWRIIPGIW